MKRSFLSYLLLGLIIHLVPLLTSAQKEGNIWYFGYEAGIDFNGDVPELLFDGDMFAWEGCASISDHEGNILFYTNGLDVWNANHEIMPNGSGLNGHDSSTQSAIIVKKPGPNHIYVVFTVDAFAYENGLQYSEVDMSLEGGLGDVNEIKNFPLIAPTSEKVIAVKHANDTDYWIVTLESDTNRFHAYHLNEFGVGLSPVITSLGPTAESNTGAIGYMRVNRHGNKIAVANPGLGLYHFNKQTGTLSDSIHIDEEFYGLEFNKDGSILYAAEEGEDGKVYQFDLSYWNVDSILNSKTFVGEGFEYGGALQLAPDDKIYHSGWNATHLGTISDPDVLGVDCNYDTAGMFLEGLNTGIGLPNFMNEIYTEALFSYSNLCSGDETEFRVNNSEVDSVRWYFGDVGSGLNNTSTLLYPTHSYADTGFYEVSLTTYLEDSVDAKSQWIYIKPLPEVDLGPDSVVCEGDQVTISLHHVNAEYEWQDESDGNEHVVSEPGQYYVLVTQNGCTSGDVVNFFPCDPQVVMPTIFSPNGDLQNDTFKPVYIHDVDEIEVQIYNRWGDLVFESQSLNRAWNGNIDGNEAPEGNYFYIVEYKGVDGFRHSLKGTITLVR